MRKLKAADTFHASSAPTGRLFSNRIVERFSRTHIAVPVSLFMLISLAFSIYAFRGSGYSAAPFVLLFAAGLLCFTLVEYCMHRFLYHSHDEHLMVKGTWQYTIHGVHHDYPKDKERLAMPPLLALLVSSGFFALFRSLMSDFVYAFYPGFLLGYALYLLVHYLVHAFAPPRNFLRYLWKHHSLHHYRHHDKAYGVTSPLWDYLFGTLPR
jgi:4-hydroxysphinganine ceramide fatty acyl 2-hydroxylase